MKSFKYWLLAIYILSVPSYFNFVYPGINRIFLLLGVISLFFMKLEFSPSRFFIFFNLLIVFLFFSFTSTGAFSPSIYTLLIPFMSFLKRIDVEKTYQDLVTLFLITLIPSVIVLILTMIGVSDLLPSSYVTTTYRPFIHYIGTVIQPGEIVSFSSIRFFKYSGIFVEPGDVGMCAILILIAQRFRINSIKEKLVALSGLLTFSLAFYILFAIVLLIYIVTSNYKHKIRDVVLYCIFAIVLFSTQPFKLLINERVQSVDSMANIGQLRTGGSTDIHIFSKFFFSQSYVSIIFGNGSTPYSDIDVVELGTGVSYMKFLYQYGLFGLVFLFFSIYCILRLWIRPKSSILILFIIFLYFLQRPFIVNSWYFFMFFSISSNFNFCITPFRKFKLSEAAINTNKLISY